MDKIETAAAMRQVLVIRPNAAPQEVTVAAGTTVAQLAEQMGVPDAGRMAALTEMGEALGPNQPIGSTDVLSFSYKLAGASILRTKYDL